MHGLNTYDYGARQKWITGTAFYAEFQTLIDI